MFDRIDDLLTLIVSLIAALSALVSVLEKLLRLWQAVQEEDNEVAQQLEKDILRLQADLVQQGQQIEALKSQIRRG